MATKLLTTILVIISLAFSSCLKEDSKSQTNMTENEIENGSSFSDSDSSRAPYAIATPAPCGYGFTVAISFMGNPATEPYSYAIKCTGLNTVVDSGTISNGEYTNWVLDPCTSYDFEFWGSMACPDCSTVQTIYSDGCDDLFDC